MQGFKIGEKVEVLLGNGSYAKCTVTGFDAPFILLKRDDMEVRYGALPDTVFPLNNGFLNNLRKLK